MCFSLIATTTTEIYTLSLHDALPISGPRTPEGERAELGGRLPAERLPGHLPQARGRAHRQHGPRGRTGGRAPAAAAGPRPDRKSTRLNSSHMSISYAVFCLKKKKKSK